MGCYDTIEFKCPECGKEISGQSKSGDCVLADYDYTSVPISVAQDANRHAPFLCSCGEAWFFGNIPGFDEKRISLTIERGNRP